MSAAKPRLRSWRFRLAALALGVLGGLGVLEIGLRLFYPRPDFVQGQEMAHWRQFSDDVKKAYVVDSEIGFRPRIDTEWYDEFGALRRGDEHPREKRAGVRRALFIGDSVTARGTIVDACRERWGGPRLELWNAGVEAFNTAQEVAYYRRYNRRLKPDHVVLTLHHNDFSVTPVAFYDDADKITVYAPEQSYQGLNPWLYRHCYVYRLALALLVRLGGDYSFDEGAADVERGLAELARLCEQDGARLTVLVLPLLAPPDAWGAGERRAHDTALAILKKLEIRHYDLEPPMRQALKDGIGVQQLPGDTWHPSPAVSARFVAWVAERGFVP